MQRDFHHRLLAKRELRDARTPEAIRDRPIAFVAGVLVESYPVGKTAATAANTKPRPLNQPMVREMSSGAGCG